MDHKVVKVAVVRGGDSPERDVSLRSGEGILEALTRRGWQADDIAVQSYDGLPQRLRGYRAAFNILHGGSGEDGTLQLLLELMGIAYVGSDPAASAKAMDKAEALRLLAGAGLASPRWELLPAESACKGKVPDSVWTFTPPLIVNPRREGSSLGLHFLDNPEDLSSLIPQVAGTYGDVLVEEFIPGRELTVAVLEDDSGLRALPVVELVPVGVTFDFRAKYAPGHCQFHCPAKLSPLQEETVHEVARAAHTALGCRDLSRVDIRLDPHGTPYVLEVNTLPGMTAMSTFPRAAAAAGISYDELVEHLLLRAISRLPHPSALG